ncbi:preprotein translocase subunit SecE [Pseudomonas aeruginosa]|nr:preprotein translocase subunit SecE [Pseudomonas aeruginosa]
MWLFFTRFLTDECQAEAKESRFDLLKWLLVAVLVVVAVVGNQYFSAQPILYRVLGILVLAVIAAFLALQTAKGQAFFSLAKEARVEIRKVVWPSRQETTQTTLIVVAVVLVMALLLWGLDSLLGWLVSMIVG